MILHNILKTENHESYQRLESDNLARQYDFLRSIINAAVEVDHQKISTTIIKSLNYHVISCLHIHAGEYRQCPVSVGNYEPPSHHLVPELMDNLVNQDWEKPDLITLASYSLWRLNNIHPFINGNGRTARALCYYVLCVSLGGALPGSPILPELIRQNRSEYVGIMRKVDDTHASDDNSGLLHLNNFLMRLLQQQVSS